MSPPSAQERFDGVAGVELAKRLRLLGPERRGSAAELELGLLEQVVVFMTDDSAEVRRAAAELVGPQWRAVDYYDQLKSLLSDPDAGVRREAMRGVAAIARLTGDSAVGKFLVQVARDESIDSTQRGDALTWANPDSVEAGKIARRRSILFNCFLLGDEDRSACLRAEADRLEPKLSARHAAPLDWLPQTVPAPGKTISAETTIEWLNSDVPSQRSAGLVTAVGYHDPRIAETVERMAVSDPEDRVRLKAVSLLGQLAQKDHGESVLVPLLASLDAQTRTAAVNGLGLLFWGSRDRELVLRLLGCVEIAESKHDRLVSVLAAVGVGLGTEGVIGCEKELAETGKFDEQSREELVNGVLSPLLQSGE